MTTDTAHAILVAIISDIIRASLADAHVQLGPRVERAVTERAVELLEIAGYHLTFDHNDQRRT